MKKALTWICVLAVSTTIAFGQVPTGPAARPVNVKDIVDIELLTHTEIYDKIHKEGKTTVIIANGGTEQRGPQDVLGGHTIMGHNKGVEVAKKLGNALAAPTLPFSITGVSDAQPGTVTLTSEVFMAVNVAEIESMAKNGFKYIFVMGDHGGGQTEMKQVAEAEDKKLAPTGVRVAYISDFYNKAHTDFEQYCYDHHIPIPSHAGVSDTSEMMYWETTPNEYVRAIYKTVPFDPGPTPEQWKMAQEQRAQRGATPAAAAAGGQRGGGTQAAAPASAGAQAQRGQRATDPNAAARVNNGITGDPHMSSKEIGKVVIDFTVNDAAAEISRFMATWKSTAARQ